MATSNEPLDATLTLDLGSGSGRFRVTWYVAGEPPVREKEEAQLSPDFQLELRGFVEAARQRHGFWSTGLLLQRCRDLGGRLLQQVLPGQMRGCYESAFRSARPTHRGLRLRLQLPPELEDLPWEILYDAAHNLFLAANLFTTLVRTTPSPLFRPRLAELPLKCLVVAAQPLDAPPLSVAAEVDALRGALADLLDLGMWELRLLQGPDTYQQLLRRRDRHEFHVIHFIGHGLLDQAGQHSCLVFEDASSTAQRIDANALVPVLSGYTNLTLLVLNSCCGGQSLAERPYTSIAHELARLELGAIVAMQREVADDSALICARELYRSVASGESVDRALNAARLSLKETVRTELVCDWFNPQLYLCASQSQLFLPSPQKWPWERMALAHVERHELAESLAVWRRAAQVLGTQSPIRERLLEVAKTLATAAEQRRDWDSLQQLADSCHELRLDAEIVGPWSEIAANRKAWTESIHNPLMGQLQQADPVELGLAVDWCERLLDGIVHNRPEVVRGCYAGRAHLRQRFWASDVEELRQLLAGVRIVPVRGHAVKVLRVIDRLLDEDGHTVRGVEDEEKSVTANATPASLAWQVLGHHPLHSPQRLQEARAWIAAHPECVARDPEADSATQILEESWLAKLGPDMGLVLWMLGKQCSALTCWEAEVREFRQRTRQIEGHHHLALAHLIRAKTLVDETDAKSELIRSIHSWAVLLDETCPEVVDYWTSRWGGRPFSEKIDDGTVSVGQSTGSWLASLRNAILKAVRECIHSQSAVSVSAFRSLQNRAATDPDPAEATRLRAIKLVSVDAFDLPPISPDPAGSPQPDVSDSSAEPTDLWSLELDCERAATMLISRIADHSRRATVPWGGYGTVIRFRWQDALRVFAKSAGPTCAPPGRTDFHESPEGTMLHGTVANSAIDLRCAFSTLRYAWWLEHCGAPPREVFDRLGNALPAFLDVTTRQWFAELRGPSEVLEGETLGDAATVVANPLHDAPTLVSDWKTLMLRALLREARGRLATDGPQFESLEATVEIVESLRHLEAAQAWIEKFQQEVVHEIRNIWRRTTPDRAVEGLPQLQLLTRLGMPVVLREALAEGLLIMASQLAENGQLEQCTAILAQALGWNPECHAARELLAHGLLNEARKLHGIGESESMIAVLKDLRQVLSDARPFDDAFEQLACDADALETLGTNAASATDDVPNLEVGASEVVPADLWRQRLQRAQERQTEGRLAIALDELCDAVLLLPEREDQTLCIEAFAELASNARDILFEWEVLRKGREFFPESPILEDRWRELHRRVKDGE